MTLTLIIVACCLGASAIALWLRWSPSLAVSILIGLAVRVPIVYVSARIFPQDVAFRFYHVGLDVLHGHDPLIIEPKYQWNFLPFVAYLFAAAIKSGITWAYAVKILPIACDLATIALVGRFVRDESRRRNAQFLYALCPLAILVSAWHGQIDPISIFLGLCAILLARRQQAVAAGVVVGFAIASKSWPVLFVPGVLLYLPVRRWWRAIAPAVVVLAAWASVIRLALHDNVGSALKEILSYRSFSGTFGWSSVVRYTLHTNAGYTAGGIQKIGTILTVAGIVAVIIAFRRRWPEQVVLAVFLAFLATTSGAGPQYLLWPAALLYASRRPAGYVYLALSSVYATFFYLYAYPHSQTFRSWPGVALMALSIPIVVFAVASMPWSPSDNPGARPPADTPQVPEPTPQVSG